MKNKAVSWCEIFSIDLLFLYEFPSKEFCWNLHVKHTFFMPA